MQTGTVRQGGIHERRGKVEAAARGLEHTFQQTANGLGAQVQAGEFTLAVAGNEDFVGRINPDFLNALIVEEGLDDPKAADFIVEPLDDDAPLPQVRQGNTGALLLVLIQALANECAHSFPVPSRVQIAATHGLTNVLFE